jgi:hypothetical protein
MITKTIKTINLPPEFQQIIREKSRNFSGRKHIFKQIQTFLNKYPRGYLTIVGFPGSGKTALLAQYYLQNPNVIYYNCQLPGKNNAPQFLLNICTQLIENYPTTYPALPENAAEDGWLFGLLIQQVSDLLEDGEKLIIAIDGLEAINRQSQPLGSNLFYLPRYVPNGVYFLLSRRPFIKAKSGILIEAPSQKINLDNFPAENLQDVKEYLGNFLDRPPETAFHTWLNSQELTRQQFIETLAEKSDNNLMYVSEILKGITSNFYPQGLDMKKLPPGLTTYYQSHWQQMVGDPPNTIELGVINALANAEEGLSVDAVAANSNLMEFDVEEVLENWVEFLKINEDKYQLYHSSFQQFVANRAN